MRLMVSAVVAHCVLFSIAMAGDAEGTALKPPRVAASRCCCPPRVAVCPDDYCRKPAPRLPCPPCAMACDDYCRKPIPCVRRNTGGALCDDYCRNPLPNFCWPESNHTRCVPSNPLYERSSSIEAARPTKTANVPNVRASR